VGGPNTTRSDHNVVLLDHATGSLDAIVAPRQSTLDERSDTGDLVHFSFVIGNNFDPFPGPHASIYAIHVLGKALQINSLLEAECGEILGILVLHLSVENLVAFGGSQSSVGEKGPGRNAPNNQGGSVPDVLSLSERILGYRGNWKVEFGEAGSGGGGDHCPEAGGRKFCREGGEAPVTMVKVLKRR
jgi:hypothetical protein